MSRETEEKLAEVMVAASAPVLPSPPEPEKPADTEKPTDTSALRPVAAERLPRSVTRAGPRHSLLWVGLVLGAALFATYQFWPAGENLPQPVTARSEILEIEQRLSDLAFPPGEIDGVADQATADAIRDFQRVASLTEDGAATPDLLAELRALTE